MRPAGSTRPPRLRSAYTLLEMLIVVAILAIAAALLVPNLVRRDTFTIETVLRKLVADLTFAQSDAIADQDYRWVIFDQSGWGVYKVDRAEDQIHSGNGLTDGDPRDLTSLVLVRDPLAGGGQAMRLSLLDDTRYRGVSIWAIDLDGGQDWLTFDPLGGTIGSGGVPGTGGSLEVRSDSLTYRVSIDAFTGKVSVARVDP